MKTIITNTDSLVMTNEQAAQLKQKRDEEAKKLNQEFHKKRRDLEERQAHKAQLKEWGIT